MARRSRRMLFIASYLLLIILAGCTYRPAAFDLSAARNHTDLAATEIPESRRVRDGVAIREVRFTSAEWKDGRAHPIRIQAFLAMPPGNFAPQRKPAVIFAHGLGGQGDPVTAVEICRNLDVVALALSGPGLGGSEGIGVTPENAQPLFAAAQDIRQSWLYAYVYAILRAITYLQTLQEVDPEAIALTGFSLGGIATFIANGVDDRIRGALPVAATGGLLRAAEAPTWLRSLVLSVHGLRPEDPGPMAVFRSLDPLAYARQQHGAVYMLIGAQDEYFPLPEVARTYLALRAPEKRLALVADYDHGWYFAGGCTAACMPHGPMPPGCPPAPVCPTACPPGARTPYCGPAASYNRQADFSGRWALLLRALLARHVARPPRPFLAPPPAPTIERRSKEIVIRTTSAVRAVRLNISEDCGFTFRQISLGPSPDGAYHFQQPIRQDSILFAEAEGTEGAVSTSVPGWPPNCKLHLRPFGPRP